MYSPLLLPLFNPAVDKPVFKLRRLRLYMALTTVISLLNVASYTIAVSNTSSLRDLFDGVKKYADTPTDTYQTNRIPWKVLARLLTYVTPFIGYTLLAVAEFFSLVSLTSVGPITATQLIQSSKGLSTRYGRKGVLLGVINLVAALYSAVANKSNFLNFLEQLVYQQNDNPLYLLARVSKSVAYLSPIWFIRVAYQIGGEFIYQLANLDFPGLKSLFNAVSELVKIILKQGLIGGDPILLLTQVVALVVNSLSSYFKLLKQIAGYTLKVAFNVLFITTGIDLSNFPAYLKTLTPVVSSVVNASFDFAQSAGPALSSSVASVIWPILRYTAVQAGLSVLTILALELFLGLYSASLTLIFKAASYQYGAFTKARINFKKLIEQTKNSRENDAANLDHTKLDLSNIMTYLKPFYGTYAIAAALADLLTDTLLLACLTPGSIVNYGYKPRKLHSDADEVYESFVGDKGSQVFTEVVKRSAGSSRSSQAEFERGLLFSKVPTTVQRQPNRAVIPPYLIDTILDDAYNLLLPSNFGHASFFYRHTTHGYDPVNHSKIGVGKTDINNAMLYPQLIDSITYLNRMVNGFSAEPQTLVTALIASQLLQRNAHYVILGTRTPNESLGVGFEVASKMIRDALNEPDGNTPEFSFKVLPEPFIKLTETGPDGDAKYARDLNRAKLAQNTIYRLTSDDNDGPWRIENQPDDETFNFRNGLRLRTRRQYEETQSSHTDQLARSSKATDGKGRRTSTQHTEQPTFSFMMSVLPSLTLGHDARQSVGIKGEYSMLSESPDVAQFLNALDGNDDPDLKKLPMVYTANFTVQTPSSPVKTDGGVNIPNKYRPFVPAALETPVWLAALAVVEAITQSNGFMSSLISPDIESIVGDLKYAVRVIERRTSKLANEYAKADRISSALSNTDLEELATLRHSKNIRWLLRGYQVYIAYCKREKLAYIPRLPVLILAGLGIASAPIQENGLAASTDRIEGVLRYLTTTQFSHGVRRDYAYRRVVRARATPDAKVRMLTSLVRVSSKMGNLHNHGSICQQLLDYVKTASLDHVLSAEGLTYRCFIKSLLLTQLQKEAGDDQPVNRSDESYWLHADAQDIRFNGERTILMRHPLDLLDLSVRDRNSVEFNQNPYEPHVGASEDTDITHLAELRNANALNDIFDWSSKIYQHTKDDTTYYLARNNWFSKIVGLVSYMLSGVIDFPRGYLNNLAMIPPVSARLYDFLYGNLGIDWGITALEEWPIAPRADFQYGFSRVKSLLFGEQIPLTTRDELLDSRLGCIQLLYDSFLNNSETFTFNTPNPFYTRKALLRNRFAKMRAAGAATDTDTFMLAQAGVGANPTLFLQQACNLNPQAICSMIYRFASPRTFINWHTVILVRDLIDKANEKNAAISNYRALKSNVKYDSEPRLDRSFYNTCMPGTKAEAELFMSEAVYRFVSVVVNQRISARNMLFGALASTVISIATGQIGLSYVNPVVAPLLLYRFIMDSNSVTATVLLTLISMVLSDTWFEALTRSNVVCGILLPLVTGFYYCVFVEAVTFFGVYAISTKISNNNRLIAFSQLPGPLQNYIWFVEKTYMWSVANTLSMVLGGGTSVTAAVTGGLSTLPLLSGALSFLTGTGKSAASVAVASGLKKAGVLTGLGTAALTWLYLNPASIFFLLATFFGPQVLKELISRQLASNPADKRTTVGMITDAVMGIWNFFKRALTVTVVEPLKFATDGFIDLELIMIFIRQLNPITTNIRLLLSMLGGITTFIGKVVSLVVMVARVPLRMLRQMLTELSEDFWGSDAGVIAHYAIRAYAALCGSYIHGKYAVYSTLYRWLFAPFSYLYFQIAAVIGMDIVSFEVHLAQAKKVYQPPHSSLKLDLIKTAAQTTVCNIDLSKLDTVIVKESPDSANEKLLNAAINQRSTPASMRVNANPSLGLLLSKNHYSSEKLAVLLEALILKIQKLYPVSATYKSLSSTNRDKRKGMAIGDLQKDERNVLDRVELKIALFETLLSRSNSTLSAAYIPAILNLHRSIVSDLKILPISRATQETGTYYGKLLQSTSSYTESSWPTVFFQSRFDVAYTVSNWCLAQLYSKSPESAPGFHSLKTNGIVTKKCFLAIRLTGKYKSSYFSIDLPNGNVNLTIVGLKHGSQTANHIRPYRSHETYIFDIPLGSFPNNCVSFEYYRLTTQKKVSTEFENLKRDDKVQNTPSMTAGFVKTSNVSGKQLQANAKLLDKVYKARQDYSLVLLDALLVYRTAQLADYCDRLRALREVLDTDSAQLLRVEADAPSYVNNRLRLWRTQTLASLNATQNELRKTCEKLKRPANSFQQIVDKLNVIQCTYYEALELVHSVNQSYYYAIRSVMRDPRAFWYVVKDFRRLPPLTAITTYVTGVMSTSVFMQGLSFVLDTNWFIDVNECMRDLCEEVFGIATVGVTTNWAPVNTVLTHVAHKASDDNYQTQDVKLTSSKGHRSRLIDGITTKETNYLSLIPAIDGVI